MFRRLLTILLLLSLLLAGYFILDSPTRAKLASRFALQKLQGSLPYVGWTDILRRALPSWLKEPGPDSRLPPATVKEQDESDCPVLWATPVGEFWGRLADGRLLDFLVNEQERQKTYQRGPVVIRPGDVVLDVGAHLGTFTRIALRDGAAKIVAFEIEPVSIRCFKKTFRKELSEGLVVLVEEAA